MLNNLREKIKSKKYYLMITIIFFIFFIFMNEPFDGSKYIDISKILFLMKRAG